MNLLDLINLILQYFVIPLAAFIWVMYQRQQDHHTDIAVLKSIRESDKTALDQELAGVRENTNKIFTQLKSIEEFLRK